MLSRARSLFPLAALISMFVLGSENSREFPFFVRVICAGFVLAYMAKLFLQYGRVS